jgi:flagellar biosynthesis/type III secretory pathway protein FliH
MGVVMQTWKPPSFDAPLPPLPEMMSFDSATPEAETAQPSGAGWGQSPKELQALRSKAHQEGFVRGLQEGLEEGRLQGETLGREEGLRLGGIEGHALGLEQGLQEGRQHIEELTRSLQTALESLTQLPRLLEPGLAEWVYQIARRLSGQEAMGREPFVQAVQEALMRLPHPGETLFLRISEQDLTMWQRLQQDLPTGMAMTLLEDSHLGPGHAYLEVAGTRVDVGAAARDALVRSALGLLPLAADKRG